MERTALKIGVKKDTAGGPPRTVEWEGNRKASLCPPAGNDSRDREVSPFLT